MMAEEQNELPIAKQDEMSMAVDMGKAVEVLKKLEESGEDEMPYGTIVFWISIIKKCEKIPDDISMADFHAFLCKNAHKSAIVAVSEDIKGGEDAGDN